MRTSKGFTLVELLVVMAIITILAGFLLPVLRKSRRMANSVACMNNLKNIGHWALAYADEWSGRLPYQGGTSNWWAWGNKGLKCNSNWYDRTQNWLHPPELKYRDTPLHCPTTTSALINKKRWVWWGRSDSDYAINGQMGGWWSYPGFTPTPPKPSTQILTSRRFWFADGKCSEIAPGWTNWMYLGMRPGSSAGSWMMNPVSELYGQGHPGNSANFLFGDTHVKGFNREKYDSMSVSEKNAFGALDF